MHYVVLVRTLLHYVVLVRTLYKYCTSSNYWIFMLDLLLLLGMVFACLKVCLGCTYPANTLQYSLFRASAVLDADCIGIFRQDHQDQTNCMYYL